MIDFDIDDLRIDAEEPEKSCITQGYDESIQVIGLPSDGKYIHSTDCYEVPAVTDITGDLTD